MTLISQAASRNGTGQAAVEAEDGEAIPTDDPKAFTQLQLGGIDQTSYAFFMGVRQLRESIAVPMMQFIGQAGITFDLEAFWRLLGRYTGLHELAIC